MTNDIITKERQETILESVQARIEAMSAEGSINFPPNYSVANALRAAWLIIKETKDRNSKPALDVCTKESVCNALLYTVIQGLNPAKKQIYYIVYGNQLQAQRSYFGTMQALKRVPGIQSIVADVVYPNDTFKASKRDGCWVITEHDSDPANIDPEALTYAYCIIHTEDGTYTEIMNRKQIEQAWSKSKTSGGVHKEFPDQMAKKTVISRACKYFLNSSDDSDMMIEAFNATDDRMVDEPAPAVEARKDERLQALNAILDIEEDDPAEPDAVEQETPPVVEAELASEEVASDGDENKSAPEAEAV